MIQNSEIIQIDVRNLWKVFGNNPRLVFQDEYASASRSESRRS